MIRKNFSYNKSKIYEIRKNTTKISKILITMGGTDNLNLSLKIIKLIYKYNLNKYKITLVIGKNNNNFSKSKNT